MWRLQGHGYNPAIKVDKYPLPTTEEIFASLSGGVIFSKLDLRQAYLQMEVDDDTQKILTIHTHKGLYLFKRLAFGVASAPAIWQRTMEQILQGIPMTRCLLDDIVVTGKAWMTIVQTWTRFWNAWLSMALLLTGRSVPFSKTAFNSVVIDWIERKFTKHRTK